MPQDIGEFLQYAQRLLSEKPTIVLGSGSSAAVGLPTMQSLGRYLLEEVDPGGDPDREIWEQFVCEFSSSGDLESSLDKVELSNELLEKVISAAWECINAPDIALGRSARSDPSKIPLTSVLRHFLRIANPKLDVVTTNYDRVVEYAANLVGAHAHNGFSPGWIQYPEDPINIRGQKQVRVWKVHGSLDWFDTESTQCIGVPLQSDIPEGLMPAMVTPGVSKYRRTHSEPFRTVLGAADRALESASAFLCSGYGFNDEHVHPKISEAVFTHGVPLVVLARTLTPSAKRFLAKSPSKYLALEKCETGTRVYSPANADGFDLTSRSWWDLGAFVQEVLES